MTISLRILTLDELRAIAQSRPLPVAANLAEDALAPPFVARRTLGQLEQGKSAAWCSTFHIVREADGQIVGGCGFKDEPAAGRVEIGYGVAPGCQRQGIATAAVQVLLDIAFASADVREVLAAVGADNAASTRVVQKLGFAHTGTVLEDGDTVVQWLRHRAA